MRRLQQLRNAAVLIVLVATGVSCDRQRAERLPESGASLEGTVKFRGEDVRFALIIAQTPAGSATGKIGEDGRYKVENVPLGEVRIAVNTEAGRGDFMSMSMSRSAKGGESVMPMFVDVPGDYGDPETSGIKTTIHKGQNHFDIVIPK
jgi:hypothetical protein